MLSAYTSGNMVAVMDVPQNETQSYGIVTPGKDNGKLVEVTGLVEKPTPEQAPSNIAVVGRYIIEPEYLPSLTDKTGALAVKFSLLTHRRLVAPFHGFRFSGERFDCGSKIGFTGKYCLCLATRRFKSALCTGWQSAPDEHIILTNNSTCL